MRFFLLMIFLSVYFSGHGQNLKIGFRAGVSLSNLYAHHSPGKIPDFTFQENPRENPREPPVVMDLNGGFAPLLHYYETDLIKDMRTGFFSFFYLDWEVKKRLSAEIGLGYAQKGIDMEYNLSSTSINFANSNMENLTYEFNRNLRFDYMVIPLTFQFMLDRKERFYVLAGIYNAVAVNFLIKESLVATDKRIFDPSGNPLKVQQKVDPGQQMPMPAFLIQDYLRVLE